MIGLIGGGQLARMLIYRGAKLGLRFAVLDPDPAAGAAGLADLSLTGGLHDPAALADLVRRCEVTTYDIEHCDTAALAALEASGHRILPSPRLLQTLQDKVAQKEAYLAAGLPVAPFLGRTLEQLGPGDYPVVQKSRHGGYDGRGVLVLRSAADLLRALPGATFLEAAVDLTAELGVMVARGRDRSLAVYPVTEMVFDPGLNICTRVEAPARLDPALAARARDLAVAVVEALDGVGVFGVELFLSARGDLLVNETAPRPHNSGHYSMEACRTDQFENHLRAVLGWPLGDAALHSPAVMVNLLGQGSGPVRLRGLSEALAIPGFSLHLYGKAECRPGRKMGHFTVSAPDEAAARERARQAEAVFAVTGGDHA